MAGNRSHKLVRQSRFLGIALSSKAERYMQRRPYCPGEHGRGRTKGSGHLVRLKKKQRLHAQHGIHEAQMRHVWEEAHRAEGLSGEDLAELPEICLDAPVLCAESTCTIAQVRQVAAHRHLPIDGKIVDCLFFRVKPGQTVQVKPRLQALPQFHVAVQGAHRDAFSQVPGYLDADLEKPRFTLIQRSKCTEVSVTCDVQMVVEHYSR